MESSHPFYVSQDDSACDHCYPMISLITFAESFDEERIEPIHETSLGGGLAPAGAPRLMGAQARDDVDSVVKSSCQSSNQQLFRLVCRGWGSSPARRVSMNSLLLCDISPLSADSDDVRNHIKQNNEALSIGCEIVRWKGSFLLLGFNSDDDIRSLCGSLPYPFKKAVTAVEAESMYPCFLQINSSSSTYEMLKAELHESVVLPFSGPRFLNVSVSPVDSSAVVGREPQLPRFIILLKLSTRLGGTPALYKRLVDRLSKDCWAEVDESLHKLEYARLYIHSACPGVGIALIRIDTGMASGVQYILNVSNEMSMEGMMNYYKELLPVTPSTSTHNQVETVVFPLDKYSEFSLRKDSAVTVSAASLSVSPCFVFKSLSHMNTFTMSELTPSGWQRVTDPDGNTVNVTAPLA